MWAHRHIPCPALLQELLSTCSCGALAPPQGGIRITERTGQTGWQLPLQRPLSASLAGIEHGFTSFSIRPKPKNEAEIFCTEEAKRSAQKQKTSQDSDYEEVVLEEEFEVLSRFRLRCSLWKFLLGALFSFSSRQFLAWISREDSRIHANVTALLPFLPMRAQEFDWGSKELSIKASLLVVVK